MTDLNTMLREHAKTGLQSQLDAAVTNGDTAAATKIAKEMSDLAIATAPKAPPYGDAEIRAELNKLDWFGTDPVKSGRALSLGKDMDPKKFPDAAAFAAALVKAVEAGDKIAPKGPKAEDEENEEDEDEDNDGEEDEDDKKPAPKKKRTDGPGESDTGVRTRRASSGPWVKMSDAPADVQKEVKRAADKFLSSNTTKEARAAFEKNALASHYNAAQAKKGKK
jgi:hypothetical protein